MDRPSCKSLPNIRSLLLYLWMCCEISDRRNRIHLCKSNVHSSLCRSLCARFIVFKPLHTLVDLSFGIHAWHMYCFSWIWPLKHYLCSQFSHFSNWNLQKTLLRYETLQHFEVFCELYLGFRHSFIPRRLHKLHGTSSRKVNGLT